MYDEITLEEQKKRSGFFMILYLGIAIVILYLGFIIWLVNT